MSYNALNPPPLVRDKPANEVMRAAVHNGELHFALRRGFELGDRVWLHTCTLDSPQALPNYEARGMRIFKRERRG